MLHAIRNLLEHCDTCSYDNLGYIHYIPKELVDDAKREYEDLQRYLAEWKK